MRGRETMQVTLTVGKGGLENMVANLAVGVARRGCSSTVLALDEGGINRRRLEEAGVPCLVAGGRSLYSPRFHKRVRSILQERRPAVVHTHHFSPLLHALLAGRGLDARWIHTEHAHEYLLRRRDYRLMLRFLSRRVHRFVVVGEHQVDYYVERVGVDPDRIVVIRNGVDTSRFRPLPAHDGGPQPSDWPSGFVAATAARLAPEKMQRTMVQAVARATQLRPALELHIVLMGDGPERSALEGQAAALGVSDKVHFLGWREDLPQLLPHADVFVLASASEGLPLAVLEAMASGVPVLSTPVGDLPRVVQEGSTGGFFRVGDAEGLAAHLIRFAEHPEERRRLGGNARAHVQRQFSEAAMVDQYMALYDA
ncbi:MAG: glycosyltransferase [Gemmatimonadota bacterium]